MNSLIVPIFVVAIAAGASSACAPATGSGSSTTARHHSGHHGSAAPLSFAKLPKIGMRATCPVMKHAFTIQKGTRYSVHQGRYYVFCCPGCKSKFEANPDQYLNR